VAPENAARRRSRAATLWLMSVATETTINASGGQSAAACPPALRLSLARIEEAARRIDAAFVDTPQFVSEPLSDVLGCRLTLKIETVNPVRSFKGRGADFFVASRLDQGPLPSLACASAGNFGQALAFACRKHGVALTVFAARNANALKVERMRALGATVRQEGDDFDGAKAIARRWAAAAGALFVEDGLEPTISEGAGTIGRELLARGDAFDDVLVPLGNGALLNGVGRWLQAASPVTRVVGVSSRGASAMAESWRAGPSAAVIEHPRVDTIADGIAVRVPIPEAVADMHGAVDDVWLVDDDAIVGAMRLIRDHIGLLVEPAGAAAIAAVMVNAPSLTGRRVAAVLTGGNVTADAFAALLARAPAPLRVTPYRVDRASSATSTTAKETLS
jgi:threonine dehydratase